MRKPINEIVRDFTFASNRLRASGKLHWRSPACAFLISCASIALAFPLLAQVPVTLVAREGDPAPGAGDGVVFENLFAPSINNANEVLFAAVLSGTGVASDNKDGIWTGPPGNLQLLARDGDPAPGLAEG